MRKQSAVYWPLGGIDSGGTDFDEYGVPQYSTPVQIRCRWVDTSEVFLNAMGEQQVSHAKVYVDRDVVVRGVLMLGTLADVTDVDDPKSNDNAWEIQRFEKLPNLRNTENLRTVFL
jgi:hypothetical protein